jgi:hypothetical protein
MASANITYTTHNQTIYFKADQPPPFYQQIVRRHWVISAVEGDVPATLAKEFELYKDLPDRLVTVPLLHHLWTRLVPFILLLLLTSAMLVRVRPPQQRINRRAVLCLILGTLISAWFDHLETCTLGLTAYLALIGLPYEALISLGVLTLAYKGWSITAISLTVAFTTAAASSVMVRSLPDYDTFFANLRPSSSSTCTSQPGQRDAPSESQLQLNSLETTQDRGCLICWDSEDILLQMPCHSSHIICKACLSRLHAADKRDCPFCFQSLWTYQSRSRDVRIELRHFIVTSAIATLVLTLSTIALQLYKGYSLNAALFGYPILRLIPLALWLSTLLPDERSLETANLTGLWILLGYAAFFFLCSAFEFHRGSQLTLWDGVILKRTEVWSTVRLVVPVSVERVVRYG